jgi:hypothetical protein
MARITMKAEIPTIDFARIPMVENMSFTDMRDIAKARRETMIPRMGTAIVSKATEPWSLGRHLNPDL